MGTAKKKELEDQYENTCSSLQILQGENNSTLAELHKLREANEAMKKTEVQMDERNAKMLTEIEDLKQGNSKIQELEQQNIDMENSMTSIKEEAKAKDLLLLDLTAKRKELEDQYENTCSSLQILQGENNSTLAEL